MSSVSSSSRIFSFIALPVVMVAALQLSGCTKRVAAPPPAGGVYLSTNAGASFDQSVAVADKPGSYIAQYSLGTIHRDSNHPDVVYMAAGDRGVVISYDDSTSWTVVPTILSNTSDVVLLENNILVASGVGQDNQGYIVRSLDAGKSWETVHTIPIPARKTSLNLLFGSSPTPSVITSLAIDPFHSDRVYASTTLGSIFVGENSAKVWRSIYTPPTNSLSNSSPASIALRTIKPSPFKDGELLVITNDNRLLKIKDGVTTRIRIPKKGELVGQSAYDAGRRVYDVEYVANSPQALFVGTSTGAVVSRDAGATWHELDLPVETNSVFNTVAVAVSPTNINRLFVAINDVIYRSEDGGKTWNTNSLEIGSFVINDLSINPGNPSRVLLNVLSKKT